MRLEKAKQYQTAADEDDGPYSAGPVAAANTSSGAGKKRPAYETLMSRPRHFSQGHYMNVKPSGVDDDDDDVDDDLIATDSPQVERIFSVTERVQHVYIFFFSFSLGETIIFRRQQKCSDFFVYRPDRDR